MLQGGLLSMPNGQIYRLSITVISTPGIPKRVADYGKKQLLKHKPLY
jgi:hypothetical protein